jgi:hypothetical protein
MGVDTSRSRIVIFLIAALHACVSGWLYAHLQRFVNPTPFGLHIGIEYLFMAVVGGAGHVWGALVGAGVITVLKQWLQDILPKLLGRSGNFEVIVFGVMMIIVLQRARDGLWPCWCRLVPVRAGPRRSPRPSPAAAQLPQAGEVILEAQGDPQVRRPGGQQQHEPDREGRRDPGPDRPQRRRQEHHVQPASPASIR